MQKKKSEITSSSSLMLNGESRTMEPCVIVNKSTSGICIVWRVFLLSPMPSASQKDALPHAFRSVRTEDGACLPCVCPSIHAAVPTSRWFTRWYDSSRVCIPAASREALHVRGNAEVLLKNRPASFIFWSFCLLHDLSGVASTNVCPCCCASCSLLPSSPTC